MAGKNSLHGAFISYSRKDTYSVLSIKDEISRGLTNE